MKAQKGFTLVEIAIVLVIIGLLLGGVLKGQEMIESGRVKSAAADMNGITAAYNTYIDRYRRPPGDDGPTATLAARGANWTTVTGGDANGTIAITAAQTFTAGGETVAFFSTLRAAGLLTGNPGATGTAALPNNAWGGLTSITNANTQGRGAAMLQICMGNVPGKAAQNLDTTLDDGVPNTGSLRATPGASNATPGGAPATYTENQTYSVCRNL